MPSFLINPDDIENDKLVIAGKEAHHIQRVLRLGIGENITLFDGAGCRYEARIIQQDSRQVTVELLSQKSIAAVSLDITLIQCLPRLDKMDLVVQKTVELGASRIIPVLSKRSRSVDESRLAGKHKRWQRIVAEAAKQCGQPSLPVVENVQSLSVVLKQDWVDTLKIVFWEDEQSRNLKQVLHAGGSCRKIALVVGPEGGFADEEIGLVKANNWHIVGLGSRILRLETAAIVGMGIVQYELGDLSG